MTNNDDLDLDQDIVTLTDDEGRSLPCYVERSLTLEDIEYALLIPTHIPIEIFAWEDDEDGDEILVDVDDEDIVTIFDTARAVLAEQDLLLQRTALTLTAIGELPEPDEDDIIVLDLAESGLDTESEQEELQTLATFFHDEQEFTICTPINPLLFFVQMTESGEPRLIDPAEFRRIQPQLEEQLFDDLDD